MPLRGAACILAILVAGAIAAPAAVAATVTYDERGVLSIVGANEASAVSVATAVPGPGFAVLDRSVRITAGPGCVRDAVGRAAVCGADGSASPLVSVQVDLGGGDDELSLFGAANLVPREAPATVLGGGGDDLLAVYYSTETRIDAGPGDDRVKGPASGRSVLLGGGGSDGLKGGASTDTLDGGPGNDRLVANGGSDVIRGAGGDDRLEARDETRDLALECGGGHDRLEADRFDPRPRRCERR